MHDILTTEEVLPWNKDLSINDGFGLYQLLNSIWLSEVQKLYIKLLVPPDVKELNDKNKDSNYFHKKIYSNQESDLFKAVIPQKIYEATPKINKLVHCMADLFQDTFNAMYKAVTDVVTINVVRDRREHENFKNAKDSFKKDVQNNIKDKMQKEIDENKEKCKKFRRRK